MGENEEPSESDGSNTSYQGLFVIGIVFLGAGSALMVTNPAMIGLLVMGIVFMAVGLTNRDKWQSQ